MEESSEQLFSVGVPHNRQMIAVLVFLFVVSPLIALIMFIQYAIHSLTTNEVEEEKEDWFFEIKFKNNLLNLG